MRIISQDGSADLSYEYVGIAISATDGTTIIAFPVSVTDDTYWELAKYSTKEKAEEVMKMLRTEYGNYKQAIDNKGRYLAYSFNYPKVFRFPQDSEV